MQVPQGMHQLLSRKRGGLTSRRGEFSTPNCSVVSLWQRALHDRAPFDLVFLRRVVEPAVLPVFDYTKARAALQKLQKVPESGVATAGAFRIPERIVHFRSHTVSSLLRSLSAR